MISKDNLLDRCQYNPFLRDRVPIISQTYNSRKTVRLLLLIAILFIFILFYFILPQTVIDEKFLYFNDVFSIDPVVSKTSY